MTVTDADLIEHFNPTARTSYTPDVPTPTNARKLNRINTTLEPDDEELEIASQIRQLFYDARAHRRQLLGRWNKSYKILRARGGAAEGLKGFQSAPNVPEIFPICRSIVGWMTDRRFHHTVSVASAPFTNYYEFYDKLSLDLETVLDSTWSVNCEEAEVTKMLWDAYTFGTGILKTTWDNTLAGGMGDAKIRWVDIYGLYVDPQARSFDDANYIIEAKQMSLQELDRRFPGSWKKFRSSAGIVEGIDERPGVSSQSGSQIARANPAAISPATSGAYGRPGGPGQLTGSRNMLLDPGVTVFECWIREHEFYEVDVYDEEKQQTVRETHIFDTWRVIVLAGNHILLNIPAEDIWSHGQHPYSRYVPYDLGEFYSVSLVEMLTSSQEVINRLLAAAVNNIELTGNPIFVEDTRANTQRSQIYNKPGMRLTKNSAGDIQWMEPPKIQTDIPNFLSYFLQRMESISGLSAINKGGTPTGRNSQGVMDAVQEAAFVGIRMALRMLEYTLRDAGYKKASLIVENYTIPRMVAIAGSGAEKSTLALRSKHFMIEGKNGSTPMEYNLLIDAGAGTDTSRKVREDKAITLFTLGALDILSLLEALDWPHREEVVKRVQEMMASGLFNPPGKRERAGH